MGMYAKAALAGLVAGVLTSIVVPLVPALVTFGAAVTGDGGTAEASFNLSPLNPLFLAGFTIAFVWSIIREKLRRRLPLSRQRCPENPNAGIAGGQRTRRRLLRMADGLRPSTWIER